MTGPTRRTLAALLCIVLGLALVGAGSSQLATGRHDDDHVELVYTGTWTDDNECAGCYLGTQHWTEETSAEVETSFDGCGLEYRFETQPLGGNADVYIDDVFQEQVNLYSEFLVDDVAWTITGLADGVHTFRAVFVDEGETNVSIDSVVVLACPGDMLGLWNALQQAAWIAYGNIILWAMGLAIAGAVFLAVAALIGRLLQIH